MNRVWKWVALIFMVLALAITGAVIYLKKHWKPLIQNEIEKAVKNASGGLYQLSYDNLDFNLTLGNVNLDRVKLIADTNVYKQLQADSIAPNHLYFLEVDRIAVKGVQIWKAWKKKQIELNLIAIDKPAIEIFHFPAAKKDSVESDKKDLHASIQDVLESVQVDKIKIEQAQISHKKFLDKDTTELSIGAVDIQVDDLLIDENSKSDTSRFYYTKNITVKTGSFEHELDDGYYVASLDSVLLSTSQGELYIHGVNVHPKMDKRSFYKQKGRNVTMADLHFEQLSAQGLQLRTFLDEGAIIADKVHIKSGKADISTDKSYPKKPENKIGDSPHQKLMKAERRINIDSVFLDNVDVTYFEFSGKYYREGSIAFNGTTGTITHITNDSTALAEDKFMRADLTSKLLNQGRFNVQFGFDMTSSEGAHTYKGTLGRMNAKSFNRILRPLLNIEITSGNIRKISFDMQANDYRNWGDFRFDYDHLKVSILQKDNTKRRSSRGVLSFLVNSILINDSNPDANNKYHVGNINYKRVPEHTFFKTLWQSLFDGIKQTAGISPEREAKLLAQAQSAQERVKETKSAVNKSKGFFRRLFKEKDKDEN